MQRRATPGLNRWIKVAVLASNLAGAPAWAGSFTVTNTSDAGPGSLRQAIIDANLMAGADVIDFSPGAFSVPQSITLTTGEMLISEAVTIDGPAAALTINGNNVTRIFNINGPGNMLVTVRDLKLALGRVTGANEGGAIYIQDENVTLINCEFNNNTSVDAAGAIQVEAAGATLAINQCTFSQNIAGTVGGAIATDGAISLTIQETMFNSNQALAGGAINQAVGGSIFILNSSMWNNQATSADGGALFFNSAFASAIIRNSTFSGNIAMLWGGAVGLGSVFSSGLTVQNCTFANNAGMQNGGAIARRVGGSAAINLTSSIFWGNSAPTGSQLFTNGTVNATVCMIASTSGVITFNGDSFTNANIGVDPMIRGLQNNGGLTFTHALQTASPAIDQGSNPAVLTTDQRGNGFAREVQGSCNGRATADIGAYEVQTLPPGCPAACCFPNGSCTVLAPAVCAQNGGTAQGPGSVCNSPPCLASCPADIAPPPLGNGTVNIDDLLLVISNWGGGAGNPGDVNHDNIVNIDDLLVVITTWGPCM